MKRIIQIGFLLLAITLLASLCMGCNQKDDEKIYNETAVTYRYELEKTEYKLGDVIQFTVEMINDSSYPSVYIGEDNFRPKAELIRRVYITEDACYDYTILYAGHSLGNDSTTRREIPPGGSQTTSFEFYIPTDAPTGAYFLRLTYNGTTKYFSDIITITDETFNETDFAFRYYAKEQAYQKGARIEFKAELTNDSDNRHRYYGIYSDFNASATLYCVVDGEEYHVPYEDLAFTEDALSTRIIDAHGLSTRTYYFNIPEDAPNGAYHLRLSYKTATETFYNVFTLSE